MIGTSTLKIFADATTKKNNEIIKVTPHICRHTFCSRMANSGINPKTLQYLMGHSSINMTMDVYAHTGYEDALKELKLLDLIEKKDDANYV